MHKISLSHSELAWSDSYLTGVAIVDFTHRQMLNVAQRLKVRLAVEAESTHSVTTSSRHITDFFYLLMSHAASDLELPGQSKGSRKEDPHALLASQLQDWKSLQQSQQSQDPFADFCALTDFLVAHIRTEARV
jgi:hypothetical protein